MPNETTLQQTIAAWQQEPGKAKGKPAVKARSEGVAAVLESGAFSWRADLPNAIGGGNEAPSPTALMLSALAGCAVTFIRATLAPQLGVRVERVEATAQCETDARGLLGMEGAAADLQSIELTVRIHTPEGPEAAERIARAWHERCPIYLALTKALQVRTDFQAV